MKWIEFWQSFENSVHKNYNLSNVDKFNYLRNKLVGEARSAIAGLALSHENYTIGIKILEERFGNVQEIIDIHYSKLMNLRTTSNSVDSLRSFMETENIHLRSLEVLDQNVDQDLIISVIKSKLPSAVIEHLEIQKGAKQKWTTSTLRDLLNEYVIACEKAEKANTESGKVTQNKFNNQTKPDQRYNRPKNLDSNRHQAKGTAEALTVNPQPKPREKP
ncbi:uncharacterized protein LOC128549322 [Mercenaria mercenaria]|uniref:uncharacterized protein LOC128549322 n=1 Tax=Mercenaria mercenaria TaxID=6596 RepID=UPI00234EDE2D|nr:uncharacterized protein LOC128549322 [Mercenaria mercenaria]